MARKVEEIEKEVSQLSPDQLRKFREWYEKFDADAWDEQIRNDAASGKLDSLADAVSFGLLPGMMLYYMLGREDPGIASFPQLVWRISPVFILSLF